LKTFLDVAYERLKQSKGGAQRRGGLF